MSKFEMLDIGTVVELLNSKEYNIGVVVEHLSASKLNFVKWFATGKNGQPVYLDGGYYGYDLRSLDDK
jgi:hypothetical protein